MAVLVARTVVRAECECGWVLKQPRWWKGWTWEEAVHEARAHPCRNDRWHALLWPELQLELKPGS